MLRHARTDRAFIVVRDSQGRRRQVALGPWRSNEAQRRFRLELAKWHARERSGAEAAAPLDVVPESVTVAHEVARWLLHCEAYYRREDGTPTSEARTCRYAVSPLLELFGDEPLESFTPRKLKIVRDRMVAGDSNLPPEKRRGWYRTVANHCFSGRKPTISTAIKQVASERRGHSNLPSRTGR